MRWTYGSRIPPVYRWSVTALVLVPIIGVLVAAAAGYSSPLVATILAVVGVALTALYWAGGTVIAADAQAVRLQLFPLWRRRVRVEQIRSLAVESVAPLGREWGTRGSLRRHGHIFVDAGQSTTCLAVHLTDGRVIRMGVDSPERAHGIVDALVEVMTGSGDRQTTRGESP